MDVEGARRRRPMPHMEVIAVPTAAAHLGCCAAAAPSLLPSACTEKERVDEIRKTS
jgi:hypothetical protein